jgi:hypothetical protein
MLRSREERDEVGRARRAAGRAKPGVTAVQARVLRASDRAVRDWTAKADTPRRPVGRPPHGEVARQWALTLVLAELEHQEWPGWRPVEAALRGLVPTRLVQWAVKELKAQRRRRVAAREQEQRTSVTVLARNVLWAEDGADVGVSPRGKETMEVLRDAAASRTVAIGNGPPARGADLVTLLEDARAMRGTYPLVVSRDNGGAQKSRELARFLEREKVIVLRNYPHTPRHNPVAERAIGELKEVSGLDAGVTLADDGEAARRLESAWWTLDHCRLRARLGYRTAAAADAEMPTWYNHATRECFYAAARAAIEEATQGCRTHRARRLAEREAIFRTLEDFGLILRTRGGRPLNRDHAARIS